MVLALAGDSTMTKFLDMVLVLLAFGRLFRCRSVRQSAAKIMHAGNFQIQNGTGRPCFLENEKGLFLHGGRFRDGKGVSLADALKGVLGGFYWKGRRSVAGGTTCPS